MEYGRAEQCADHRTGKRKDFDIGPPSQRQGKKAKETMASKPGKTEAVSALVAHSGFSPLPPYFTSAASFVVPLSTTGSDSDHSAPGSSWLAQAYGTHVTVWTETPPPCSLADTVDLLGRERAQNSLISQAVLKLWPVISSRGTAHCVAAASLMHAPSLFGRWFLACLFPLLLSADLCYQMPRVAPVLDRKYDDLPVAILKVCAVTV